MIKRTLDLIIALSAAIIFAVPYIMILVGVRLSSPGAAIHWSRRAGRQGQFFMMPKFRTMSQNTPQVATHLLENSHLYITRFGAFLRKTSLDEIPQILSVLIGHMSFVGPRPALYNQYDLI